MALHKRPLGKSGMEITTVGVGTWAIGGGGWSFGWGQQDDDASIAAIHRGVELGINWIDTAAIYGLGHSEEVVRQALAGISPAKRPMVFTKCGLTADRSNPFGIGGACDVTNHAGVSRRRAPERLFVHPMHSMSPSCRRQQI